MPDISDFKRGDTKKIRLAFTDGNGTAIDITGWQFWLTLKNDLSDLDAAAVLQVMTTVGDYVDDDAANGIVYIVATSSDTAIATGSYHYDIQRVIAGTPPDVLTILSGKVKVTQDVTLSTS
jgi:hypothetical protein